MRRRRLGRRAARAARPDDGKGPNRPEGLYFWAQLAAAVVVVVGVVGGAIVAVVHWTDDALSDHPAHLRVVVADPLNRTAEMTAGGFSQSRSSTPQVDLTIQNTGEDPVLLTKARITVVDSAWLPVCIVPGAGPVPIAGRYAHSLPFLPRKGERVVETTLHDEVPAGGNDRLKIYLQAPAIGEDDNLYALHVELSTDEEGSGIDAGRFVLGVPGPPVRNGEVLPESGYLLGHGGVYGNRLGSAWCYRHNLSELRRLLAEPGKRTPEIAALADFRPAEQWASYAHGVTADRAVSVLLADQEDSYGPLMAVYVAERTGDADLISATRETAASTLLAEAERDLGPEGAGPMFALVRSRAALSIEPSAAARAVAARAEAGWFEVEEEQEEFALQGLAG